MTVQTQNIQLINEYFQATGSGNVDKVMELLTEDVIWNVAGSVIVSTVGLLKGKERVKKWFLNFPENFQPLDFVINELFANESNVLATGRFRHLIKTTGRTAGSDLIMKFSIKDGKISRYQILEDSDILKKAFDVNYNWDMQKTKINGNIYAYKDTGIGKPVIFAHGLFMNHTIFDSQIERLEKSFRCMSFDMPGHGESGYDTEGWTLERLAEDFALFIKENNLGSVTFVGQSFAGAVGMILAARYPELIEKLILIGTTARAEYSDRIQNWIEMKQQIRNTSTSGLEKLFKSFQEKVKSQEWLSKNQDIAEKEKKIMMSHESGGLAIAIDAVVLKRKNITHILGDIKCSTVVVIGEDDSATPLELSYEIDNKIHNCKLEIIENAGHHLPIEAPEALNKTILEFINS